MSGEQDSGCEASGEGGMSADRILDVRHPEKVGRACMRIEIGVMQSEGMGMGINTVGRAPADASTSSRRICLVVCNLGYLLTAKAWRKLKRLVLIITENPDSSHKEGMA